MKVVSVQKIESSDMNLLVLLMAILGRKVQHYLVQKRTQFCLDPRGCLVVGIVKGTRRIGNDEEPLGAEHAFGVFESSGDLRVDGVDVGGGEGIVLVKNNAFDACG